jgi:hypothetical protein
MAMTVDLDLVNSVTNGDTHSLAGVFKAGKRREALRALPILHGKAGESVMLRTGDQRGIINQRIPYTYLLPANTGLYERRISVDRCLIPFQPDVEVKKNTLSIWVEIYPPGKRHPIFYETNVRYEDPANRLAFRVVYTDLSSGQEVDEYAFRSIYSAVCRANTLVDILWDGKLAKDIMQTPRRYLEVTAQKANAKPYLGTFVKGGYTDTLLGLEEQEDDIDED